MFTCVADLQHAIRCYIREQIRNHRPLVWTKRADDILAKLGRLPEASD